MYKYTSDKKSLFEILGSDYTQEYAYGCYLYWTSVLLSDFKSRMLKTLAWSDKKRLKGGVIVPVRKVRRRKYKLSGDLSVHAKKRLMVTKVGGLWWKSRVYGYSSTTNARWFVCYYMFSTFLCYPRCLKLNGVEFCFSCRIMGSDLPKSVGFNWSREGSGFKFSGGYHSKRLNHHLSYDATVYKRDILNYLKVYFGEDMCEKKMVCSLINGRIRLPQKLAKRYKHSPWLKKGVQGKKGTYFRMEKYYKYQSRLESTLIQLVCENKRLLKCTLVFIRDSLVLSDRRKEALISRILSNVTLSEWSIYSYMIKDARLRSLLVSSSCAEKVCGVYKPRYRLKSGDMSRYYKRGSLRLDEKGKYWM